MEDSFFFYFRGDHALVISQISYNTKDMKVGGHLSVAGGYTNALTKTVEIGGNCVQIFSSSPRNWGVKPVTDEVIDQFATVKNDLSIDPVYFHASYLVNFADNQRIGSASVRTLTDELTLAAKMQVRGSIVHLGSFKQEEKPTPAQYSIVFENVMQVLENTPDNSLFIIENAGNKKLNWSLEELGFIIKELNHKRVRVCLDTCHLWGAGYDLSTPELFKRYFDNFERLVGMEKLELFQINDSRDECGSFRDRHENLSFGQIPEETFKLLVNDPLTRDIPFLLEVPGINKEGPDKANLDRFKSYLNT